MQYTVQGFKGRKYRNLVAFAQSYIEQLNLNKSAGKLFILQDESPDALGRAIDTGFGEYIIFLSPKMNLPTLLQTLAHEMVHIKQYAKGHLKIKNLGVKWCGKMYKYSDNHAYSARPWELEAMRKEVVLYYTAQDSIVTE